MEMTKISFYDTELKDDGTVKLKKIRTVRLDVQHHAQSPEITAEIMRKAGLHRKAQEHMYMAALNPGLEILGVFNISKGSSGFCHVSIKDIFTRALLIGASCIIMMHNHTSDGLAWSRDDIEITEKVKETGFMLGIPLTDHILMNREGKYASMREEKAGPFAETKNSI